MKSVSLNNFLPKKCYPINGEITVYEGNTIYLIAPCVIDYNDYITTYDDSIISVNGNAKLLCHKRTIQDSNKTYSYMIDACIKNHDEFNTVFISGEKCYLDMNLTNYKIVNGQVVPLIGDNNNDHTLYCTVYMFNTSPDPYVKVVYEE